MRPAMREKMVAHEWDDEVAWSELCYQDDFVYSELTVLKGVMLIACSPSLEHSGP